MSDPRFEANGARWQLWVDTGGTFTDCVAVAPDGGLRRAKVLSSSSLRGVLAGRRGSRRLQLANDWRLPEGFFRGAGFRVMGVDGPARRIAGYGAEERLLELAETAPAEATAGGRFEIVAGIEAPLLAAHWVTGTPLDARLPPVAMRLATTRGTNALLERRGSPTALFTTRGFGDLLAIGNQQRPELFTLAVERTPPLYREVVEVDERLAPDGSVIRPLRLEAVRSAAESLLERGIDVAALALLHSYRNPQHEELLADFLRRLGFRQVSCSSRLAARIKIVARAQTTVVNAYLADAVGTYLERVAEALAAGPLHLLTSAGGLVQDRDYLPKDSLLSGPAGGAVGAAAAARRAGFERSLAFDMGGTSTDVSRFDGDFDYLVETRVGDVRLLAPSLAIETVAAGGGSICHFDGRQLKVGPESAGASPGPACYGAGGPLTLTDVNLLLGRLRPTSFEIPIDVAAAQRAAAALVAQAGGAPDSRQDGAEMLEGLLAIANERMAEAVRRISIRRGYRPGDYALVAFGGAGGQHACALADILGIDTVVVPPDAGLLSAVGLGQARAERLAERQILRPLRAVAGELPRWVEGLEETATAAVLREGVASGEVAIRRRLIDLRLSGQEASLTVDYADDRSLEQDFEQAYRDHYGYRPEAREIEVESIRVLAVARAADPEPVAPVRAARDAPAVGTQRAFLAGGWRQVPVFTAAQLRPGERLAGAALVFDRHGATVIPPGWRGRVDAVGSLVLGRDAASRPAGHTASAPGGARPATESRGAGGRPDAVELELFTHRFTAIAWQMGEALRRTALSVNVKERLDFSCGLLDPSGELVVNAPHIPVHLGALGLCVRTVRERLELRPGDVAVTNHPAFGGSHLPDVTLVTPVFATSASQTPVLLGYVASRAHHAEIGGTWPGSMPPDARRLAEEGVVMPPQYLVRGEEVRWARLREQLEQAPYPSRAVDENLADLAAAMAANHRGARSLQRLAERFGLETVGHYMSELTGQSARELERALQRFHGPPLTAAERLDDGSPLRVLIEVSDAGVVIDFAGSADVHPGNLNATPAVVRSAVIYVLRLLIDKPLPLNEGLLRRVELKIPPGMLNPPFPDDPQHAPAVVGGNVETSQRLVDTLLKALGVAACSQGTMNNVLFGNRRFGYYETIGGGCGALADRDGASAVHSHMTNTAITDPELLEHRYPVRVERFSVRRGSGGRGRFRGGDGIVRELVFLEPMSLSILSQHRRVAPYGRHGGEAGARGRQELITAAGRRRRLRGVDGCEVGAGDRLVIATPGGGGWGRSMPRTGTRE